MKLRYAWVLVAACAVTTAAFATAAEFDLNPAQDVVEDELDEKQPKKTAKNSDGENEKAAAAAAAPFRLDGMTTSDMESVREKAEKHEFQAEVNRLMNIIINSLYKNKEIFLRELISNSADALDKIRILSLNDRSQLDTTEELSIRIKVDSEKKTIDITDTGIGMTRDDLIRNLGTIAKSGTSEFLERLTQQKSVDGVNDLIGQFGVGFYSTFLIADEVLVTSKSNNDSKQHIWQSDSHSFAVIDDPRGNTLPRGTTVTLRLKDEAADFLQEKKLEDLIKKYSQFINFPIYLWSSKTEEVEEPLTAEELEKENEKKAAEKKNKADKNTDDGDAKVEEEDEEDDKPKTKKTNRHYHDWVQMNNVKPIWVRRPEEVSSDEYRDFYKAISRDWDDPLTWMHFKAEGEVTFRSLLYVPKRSPRDFLSNAEEKLDMIKLYVRRVFITDDFRDMLPKYLFFVRGVVDSDDLPLNVGRETLQQHKLLKVIKKKLVRKVLDMIKKLNQSDFEAFYKEYSTNLKLGLIDDHSNRNRIAKLLLYQSSQHASNLTTLEQYVARMKTGQDAIYYMTALSRKEAETSPFVEQLLKRGYEVLYLVEPIDEYAMQSLPEFENKRFQHVAKEGLKMGEDSDATKKRLDKLSKQYAPLLTWLGNDLLKGQIEKAELSDRLTETPCALVAKSFGWSGNFEKIRKAQAYAKNDDPSTSFYANQKKILELNPGHPVIRQLLRRVTEESANSAADADADVVKLATASTVSQDTRDMALLLYDAAVLRSGYVLNDVGDSFKRIERMLRRNMGIGADAAVEDAVGAGILDDDDDDEDDKGGKGDGIERENLKLSKPGVGDGFGGGDVGDFEDTIQQHQEL